MVARRLAENHDRPDNIDKCGSSLVSELETDPDVAMIVFPFISGRPKETRFALLKELKARIVANAGISPDDVMIRLSEGPGENVSFGPGLAQRAFVSQAA